MENGVPQGWTYHNLTQLTTWMYWFLKITTFEKRYYIWAHSTKCLGRGHRGTSSFGTDARLIEFPQMISTDWEIGSVQEVAWTTMGRHRGGYTFRLCKISKKGRPGITEECFTKHILQFATNYTMIKYRGGVWKRLEQMDLREGTFPCGSAWRPVGIVVERNPVIRYSRSSNLFQQKNY